MQSPPGAVFELRKTAGSLTYNRTRLPTFDAASQTFKLKDENP